MNVHREFVVVIAWRVRAVFHGTIHPGFHEFAFNMGAEPLLAE